MLRANQAARLGLRAASRNPELSFAKALIDQGGNLLAVLPLVLGALLVAGAARGEIVRAAALALRAAAAMAWPLLGAIAVAFALAFTASLFFWAGAVPLLAADAELDRRPPSGSFAVLVARGASRTLVAGLVAWGLPALFALAFTVCLIAGAPLAALRPSPRLFAGIALAGAAALLGGALLDMLGRLMLVRAAAFGDAASAAFAKAASLLGSRLGTCFTVTL